MLRLNQDTQKVVPEEEFGKWIEQRCEYRKVLHKDKFKSVLPVMNAMTSGLQCPRCGGANEPGGSFCVHCGTPFQATTADPSLHYQTSAGQPQPENPEKVLGMLLYAAATIDITVGQVYKQWATFGIAGKINLQNEHEVYSLIFTDRAVMAVHSSKLRLPGVHPYGPMTKAEWDSMNRVQQKNMLELRAKRWGELWRGVGKNSTINLVSEEVSSQLLLASDLRIAYNDVKKVEVKKVPLAGVYISIHTNSDYKSKWEVLSSIEEVRNLLQSTPLAPRLS
jgi:hypothetical protein